jgi:uncharacterized protein (TIGR00730 family)
MDIKPDNQENKRIVKLTDEAGVREVLIGSVFQLWDVVNNLTRIKVSKRDRYRVTVFGSARAKPGSGVYEEVKRFTRLLAEMNCDVITGGGPGLMQAANEGASEANTAMPEGSVGIRVTLPFEQTVNPYVARSYEHETFFTRLHHFILVSDAFVVTPGGIGSVLEAMMVWQLLQVNHIDRSIPLIFAGKMWPGLVEWARKEMLSFDPPLANPDDMNIPICVDTAEEAAEVIRKYRDRWLAENKE